MDLPKFIQLLKNKGNSELKSGAFLHQVLVFISTIDFVNNKNLLHDYRY
jgi:hypothetical protein